MIKPYIVYLQPLIFLKRRLLTLINIQMVSLKPGFQIINIDLSDLDY